MIENRIGNIQTFPAHPTTSDPQVGVVTVGKKALVKLPNLLQHAFAIHRPTAVWKQSFLQALVLARVPFSSSTASILAVEIDQMSSLVDDIGFKEKQFRSPHTYLFSRSPDDLHQLSYPLFIRNRIVIDQSNELSPGFSDGDIAPAGKTVISIQWEKSDALIGKGPDNGQAVIPGPIVDNQDLQRRVGLFQQRYQALPKKLPPVVVDNND